MLKHVGEIASTSKKCALVFLQLPEDPSNTLIIDTETLPDRYHQVLMSAIESKEGQAANSLADVLARRIMPDTGTTMLQTFHTQGFLRKIPVDDVNLTPKPSVKHKLREVLEAMGNIVPNDTKAETKLPDANFYQQQAENQDEDSKRAMALGLIQQASLLEADATRLKQQAYAIAPSLKPVETPVEGKPKRTRKNKDTPTE